MVVMVAISLRTYSYSEIWAIYNSAYMDSMGKSFLDVPFSFCHKSKKKRKTERKTFAFRKWKAKNNSKAQNKSYHNTLSVYGELRDVYRTLLLYRCFIHAWDFLMWEMWSGNWVNSRLRLWSELEFSISCGVRPRLFKYVGPYLCICVCEFVWESSNVVKKKKNARNTEDFAHARKKN